MTATRILIVEDEVIVAKDIQASLTHLGYDVIGTAASGEKALALLEEKRPELVLMDIVLHGTLDGIDTAQTITSHYGIPVIYLTAYSDELVLQRAKETHPFGYLLKPVEERELRITIEMSLCKARMEQALRENEERFRTVADFTYDWETWRGPDGAFIYVSPSCERISGHSPADFIDNPRLMIDLAHPDDRDRVREHFDECLETEEILHFEFRIISRSGEERWLAHVCQPVYGSEGTWLGRRASNRDITLRKEVEDQRERLIDELQEALAKVKTLSGLVPICSCCKRIRNDQGYWRQIESFIREHSDLQFSHSICPECARKLYPDLYHEEEDEE